MTESTSTTNLAHVPSITAAIARALGHACAPSAEDAAACKSLAELHAVMERNLDIAHDAVRDAGGSGAQFPSATWELTGGDVDPCLSHETASGRLTINATEDSVEVWLSAGPEHVALMMGEPLRWYVVPKNARLSDPMVAASYLPDGWVWELESDRPVYTGRWVCCVTLDADGISVHSVRPELLVGREDRLAVLADIDRRELGGAILRAEQERGDENPLAYALTVCEQVATDVTI